MTDYERGKRDGATEMRERAVKVAEGHGNKFVAFAFDPDGHKLISDACAKDIAQAIAALGDSE